MQAPEASNASEGGGRAVFFPGGGRELGKDSGGRGIKSCSESTLRTTRRTDAARKAPLRGLNGWEKVCNLGTARATLSPRGSTGGSLENETLSYVPRGVRR